MAFPDLKGQAPLRRVAGGQLRGDLQQLFLTSKVRLHCDSRPAAVMRSCRKLFLTSKVRLHCDVEWMMALPAGWVLFLTSKVRLHCDKPGSHRKPVAA